MQNHSHSTSINTVILPAAILAIFLFAVGGLILLVLQLLFFVGVKCKVALVIGLWTKAKLFANTLGEPITKNIVKIRFFKLRWETF